MSSGAIFRDRPPSPDELERLRLILSCFRDGSGQQILQDGSRPGWRDFERAVAAWLGGVTAENKGVFDVAVPVPGHLPYGLSCKTSAVGALTDSRVLFELHNSNAKAWARLEMLGIDPETHPREAGLALVAQVREWHHGVTDIDVDSSSYLVLVHDRRTWTSWRLLWYALTLDAVDPAELAWSHVGKRIQGETQDGHRLWEWYAWSGGQLKYYPRVTDARWTSEWFSLEVPTPEDLVETAREYFPELWPESE